MLCYLLRVLCILYYVVYMYIIVWEWERERFEQAPEGDC